ncbi:helix-turn-helix domain-containing protein [Enterococcus mundtii]|uniref:helix-turn-helix domain-containing protein n=1 Tax=Enterococcus mundtii TaxID=53346 RepID=UPI000DFEC555|nr:helix-turn-helix domain-containing protein [Enterococcus mundtii]STE38072.1 Mga helix-turn-helix domain [Enterococcus mundtii]
MFFLLGKKNENKLAIFKSIIFKERVEKLTLTQMQDQLGLSQVTIRNLIKEINNELETVVYIEIKNNEVTLLKNEYTIEQIVNFYSVHDNGYKLLEVLFMKPKVYTVESLAQYLYISTSHLYKVVKKFNEQLCDYNISITIRKGVYLNGPKRLIKNLFYEFLSLSNQMYEQLPFSPSESTLNRQVHIIFAEYGILHNQSNDILFSRWLITCLNFNYILNKKSIIIIDKDTNKEFPFHIEENFFIIGESVFKSLGMKKVTHKDIMELYLGLASLVLNFETKQDALYFQQNFISKKEVREKVEKLSPELLKMIDNQNELKKMTVSLEFSIEFILTYIDYFLITWKKYLDLYQFVYKNVSINYERIKKLWEKNLATDKYNNVKQEVCINLLSFMIDFFNQNTGEKMNNKRFIYKSILGSKTENLMMNKLMSLFEYPDDESSTESVYLIDDTRLMNDSKKKYMLLNDFIDYMNQLF